jgi:hypothetical protein
MNHAYLINGITDGIEQKVVVAACLLIKQYLNKMLHLQGRIWVKVVSVIGDDHGPIMNGRR